MRNIWPVYYFQNKPLTCILLLFTIASCNSKKPEGYLQWLAAQKPLEIKAADKNIRIREITPEASLINNYGNRLTQTTLDSFYANPSNTGYFQFSVEINNENKNNTTTETYKTTGFDAECYLDGKPVDDVVQENSGVQESVLRYIVITKKERIKEKSVFEFYHPLMGDKPIEIKANQISIKNKKKLTL